MLNGFPQPLTLSIAPFDLKASWSIVKTAIFAHRVDLDGLMSASIYLRKNPDSYVGFVNYGRSNIEEFIRRLSSVGSECDRVVIADFGLDEGNIDGVSKALSEVVSKGAEVFWLDHHVWNEETMSRIRSVGVRLTKVPDRQACGAELVYQTFGSGDEYSRMLADMAASTDFHREIDDQTRVLASVVDHYNGMEVDVCDSKLLRTARMLSQGVLADSETYADYLEYRSKLEKAKTLLLDSVKNLEVKGYTVCIGFREPPLGSTLACDTIRQHFKCDIQIVVRGNNVSIRRTNQNVDCSKVARELNGGGHEYAAGGELEFRVDGDETRVQAVERIKRALEKALT